MIGLARALWRSISGPIQWRLLWLLNSKFSIGVSAVVVDPEGRVLLLRHTFRREDGWSLPSGWVNSGETIPGAIVREIREETSLAVEPVTIFKIDSGFRLRVGFFLLCKTASTRADISVDGREVLGADFFALEQLPDSVPESDCALISEGLGTLAGNRGVLL